MKENETRKKKNRSLKAVEKLVLPNLFLLINNKAPNVLDAALKLNAVFIRISAQPQISAHLE